MRRTQPYQAQQGYLTFAIHSDSVDYLELAYLQALNIKATQKINQFAVVVDPQTKERLNDSHRDVFDYIIDCDSSSASGIPGKFRFEWQAFWLTPFKETIKLESDLLFTRSIDHWWHAFRLRNVFLSHGCRDYQQRISTSRRYRKVFDDNHLPDTYNGLMYFRYTQDAAEFFATARDIYQNWEDITNVLLNCRDLEPSTDLVYALTANLIGPEKCYAPSLDFINFVHMKPGIQGWNDDVAWTDTAVVEHNDTMIRINNINQLHPVHYYEKTFASTDLIKEYERRIKTSI